MVDTSPQAIKNIKEEIIMAHIEKHPAPEKLIRQITVEAISALKQSSEADHTSIAKLEAGVGLIAKAWELPQAVLQNNLDLIQRQKQNVLSGSSEEVLPPDEGLEPYDGPMIVELLWGLFETAVRLEDSQDRAAVHELAILMTDCLILDDWIEARGPAKA